MAALAYFYDLQKTANSGYIVFENSCIKYLVDGVMEREIKLNEITNINKILA